MFKGFTGGGHSHDHGHCCDGHGHSNSNHSHAGNKFSMSGGSAANQASAIELGTFQSQTGGLLQGFEEATKSDTLETATGGGGAPPSAMSVQEQLFAAVKTGATEIVKRILDGKQGKVEPKQVQNEDGTLTEVPQTIEDVVKQQHEGFYYTHFAAKFGDIEQLELLAARGCPLFEPSSDEVGMYPLHWAATANQLKCCHWLLERGADLDCVDKAGATPLVVAAQYGHADVVAYLIKAGADANALDRYQDSALHWGAYKGNVEIVGLLCHLGLPTAAQDAYGQTPAHLAALRGNLAALEHLTLNMRVDLTIKDKKGKTPLDLAIEKKKFACEKFLREQGKRWEDRLFAFKAVFTKDFLKILVTGGRGAESAAWPFYLMTGSMAFYSALLYFKLLCVEMGPHSFALMLALALFAAMWTFLFLCRRDPGFVDDGDNTLKQGYEERLEMMADFDKFETKLGVRRYRALCHTCNIERPLRAKHCKACRRCVRIFDHHCPFTGCCIARRNYRWFFIFVVLFNLSALCFIYLNFMYLKTVKKEWTMICTLIYMCGFELMAIGLFRYHYSLIKRALTTNEDINSYRFGYLKDKDGQVRSPWDQGSFAKNFMAILHCADVLEQADEELGEEAEPLVNVV